MFGLVFYLIHEDAFETLQYVHDYGAMLVLSLAFKYVDRHLGYVLVPAAKAWVVE